MLAGLESRSGFPFSTRAIVVLSLGLLVSWLTPTSAAFAYCQSTTVEPPSGCECTSEGFPTHWDEGSIPYALNARGFPGLTDEALRAAIARSFARWTQVSCAGGPVVLSMKQQRETTTMGKEHHNDSSDRNVIALLNTQEFLEISDLTSATEAFALTTTFIDRNTGEILGADIMFNEALGPFVICPESGCAEKTVDLENVATHEIGHFLGLGHSEVEDSTMACRAPKGEMEKRTLEADDEAGICATYGAIAVDEREQTLYHETTRAGCSCRLQSNAPPTSPQRWGIALALALFCARRMPSRYRERRLRRSRHR